MPSDGDIADHTVESLDEAFYRLEGMVKDLVDTVRPIPEHLNNLLSDVAALKLLQAAKEIPAGLTDVGEKAADTAGSAIGTAGATIGTVPAAATDVLEDVESVGSTTGRATGNVWKTKLKRHK